MCEIFDIQPAVDALVAAGNTVAVKGLAPGTSRFDAADSNGIFSGNVPAGAALTGQASLWVDGSLNGSQGNACLVNAGAKVLISGDVRQTRLAANTVHVSGNVRDTQVEAVVDLIINGDLTHCHIKSGGYEKRKRRIDELRHDINRTQEQRAALDRAISQDEKKLDRSCRATRVPLSFNVSTLIVQEQQRIHVNLDAFYKSIGEQPVPKLKTALNEFFAKGMIGYLAKTNRKYIIDNPARERVFMQLLKSLRQLVMQVFERDQCVFRMQQAQRKVDAIATDLEQQQPRIHIRGSVMPESTIEMIMPRVTRLDGGDVSVVHRSASLVIKQGSQAGVFRVENQDLDGESSEADVPAAEFSGVSLFFAEGEVAWEQLNAAPDA